MQEDRLVRTFLDLVRIDSPTGQEEKVRDYVIKLVQKLGLNPIQDVRGNLIVKVDGVGEPLLLGAHLDTVEPGKNINPQITDGVIKSNGDTILGADNKAAVAAILEVLRSVLEDRAQTKPLDVVFTLAEESGEFGSTKLDYSKVNAKKGYTFDSLSSLGSIITASPFYNRFHIKIIGKSTHASTPDEGINTLQILGTSLNEIKLGKINDKTIANIGIASSGNGINTIPGETIVKGEVRSFVGKDVQEHTNSIVNKFKEIAMQYGGTIEAEVFQDNPGYEYDEKDEFIQETKRTTEKLNLTPTLIRKWACSDANIFNSNGIKTLNLGDGVIDPHTVKESISIESLNLLAKLISFLIKSLH
ncbi:MAG: M20/M25/M40 family metallo-hydrolase [Candidatus Levybacteria bacterium]|nr:M20/M25/M40 family metallo-hydrolase [Candidatus Levybacteria bacterium]